MAQLIAFAYHAESSGFYQELHKTEHGGSCLNLSTRRQRQKDQRNPQTHCRFGFGLHETLSQNKHQNPHALKNDLLILFYVHECFACIYVCHMCATEAREGAGCPGFRVVDHCKLGTEPGSFAIAAGTLNC